MKKARIELDFIGGLGKLTKAEEDALTKYFSKQKSESFKSNVRKTIRKQRQEVKQ